MNKVVLVTGASGFFGKAFIQTVLEKSENTEKFVCLYNTNHPQLYSPYIQWVQCDLFNLQSVICILKEYKPTKMLHLAWNVKPNEFWTSKKNLDWLAISLKLFELFCENGGEVFISTGSIAEYDLTQNDLNENALHINPNTLYGESKASLRKLLFHLRNYYYPNTIIIWAKLAWFFGEDEPKEKFFSTVVTSILQKQPIKLVDRSIYRPYAHVKYAGAILLQCLNFEEDCIFNLSGVKQIELEEVVRSISFFLEQPYTLIYESQSFHQTPQKYNITTLTLQKYWPNLFKDTLMEDLRKFVNITQKYYYKKTVSHVG
ncbi:MAG: NAD-dependent epimerase/dehydratase family protein [Puniceicoccales bacterium]|jgi:nucleoside-diphosphate-sugar epimerase|nr:NAD-dependent epimerase/dehydratase family protein [Puniceicoccales bacterium]